MLQSRKLDIFCLTMKKLILFLILLLSTFFVQAGLFDKKPKFLKVDEAFVFSFAQNSNELLLNWQIAKGYYLYKQEIRFNGNGVKLAEITFPQAEKYKDEFFGETEIYRDELTLRPILLESLANSSLEVTYQGCTKGFCYPPETKLVEISAFLNKSQNTFENTDSLNSQASTLSIEKPLAEQDRLANSLLQSKYAVFWFFLLGIGLAFTPCVLPMLPLLSAIVIGKNERPNNLRAFMLSLVYVQGMALTYTILGLIVAAIGLPFQVALQSPYVLIGLSAIFILLAFSMFGAFSLQLPSSLQNKLNQLSQKQKSGAFRGVFIMGMIAGLVASPCTSAPLSGALLYVAQSGDLATGAITLYLLALGMGLPLIFITVFGNKILPKSGIWLEKVKVGFGFVMLALPVFLLSRVFPIIWEERLWALLGTSFCIWLAFQVRNKGVGQGWRILCLIMAMIMVKPLQNWFWNESVRQPTDENLSVLSHTPFKRIASYEELQQALQANSKSLAMLDLYADWCVACKEFEKYTFSDPRVQNVFQDVLLLQVDMTKNSPENTELMKQFNVLGLPTIIFFNQQGEEISGLRITGFMQAEEFLSEIQKYTYIK